MSDYENVINNWHDDVTEHGFSKAMQMWQQKQRITNAEWEPLESVGNIYNGVFMVRRKPNTSGGLFINRYTAEDPPMAGDIVYRAVPFSSQPDIIEPAWSRSVTMRYNPRFYNNHDEMLERGWLFRDETSALSFCRFVHETIEKAEQG